METTDTTSTPAPDRAWTRVLAAAYNHADDTWQLGLGGEVLIDLLFHLLHPADPKRVATLTDEQLEVALDQVNYDHIPPRATPAPSDYPLTVTHDLDDHGQYVLLSRPGWPTMRLTRAELDAAYEPYLDAL